MNKSILLVVGLASFLTVGLYSLPKGVVQNADKKLSGQASGGRTTTKANEARQETQSEMEHNAPLTAQQQQKRSALLTAFANAGGADKAKTAGPLIDFFRSVSRFDSAAYYGGQLADNQPTEATMLRAGDLYFEAYGFAVDDKKSADLGQKTRDFYQKALDKNPNLLLAKANMAMTYVSTQTPMKGIMLLREVIQQDPTNEVALFNLGLLSMRSNQYDRAIERFRQILAVNPDSRKARFYLGVSLVEKGEKAEAKKVLAEVKATEKDPQILAAVKELEERLGQ
jgi:tetratricopeptide (TPR) repeat protein